MMTDKRQPRRPGLPWRILLLWGALTLVPTVAAAEEPSRLAGPSLDAITVEARYKLSYNGLKVGWLDVSSGVDGRAYRISGTGKVSILFGALKWTGASHADGQLVKGEPKPQHYDVEWHANKKTTAVRMGFHGDVATDVAANPPAKIKHDTVPLLPAHKVGALDPFSAMIQLTRVDEAGPCQRRVPIFDGWQRFDLVMSFKRTTKLPADVKGGAPVTAFVCRIVYRPVAGHRDNDTTRAYVANNDAEVTLRPIAGTRVLVPHSVSIPTIWGTGAMTMTRIDITSPTTGRIALTE